MANIENLKPFTKENAKYYGKKGGIKSGKARAERKSIKEQMRILQQSKEEYVTDNRNIIWIRRY